MNSLPSVVCQLCCKYIEQNNVRNHLVKCLARKNLNKSSVKFQKYFLVAYILNFNDNFDFAVNINEKNLYDFCFSIYEHFYLVSLSRAYESALLFVDDFCRCVITSIEDPKNKYINIVPTLSYDDFMKNPKVANLMLIFSRAQFFELKCRDGN